MSESEPRCDYEKICIREKRIFLNELDCLQLFKENKLIQSRGHEAKQCIRLAGSTVKHEVIEQKDFSRNWRR